MATDALDGPNTSRASVDNMVCYDRVVIVITAVANCARRARHWSLPSGFMPQVIRGLTSVREHIGWCRLLLQVMQAHGFTKIYLQVRFARLRPSMLMRPASRYCCTHVFHTIFAYPSQPNAAHTDQGQEARTPPHAQTSRRSLVQAHDRFMSLHDVCIAIISLSPTVRQSSSHASHSSITR